MVTSSTAPVRAQEYLAAANLAGGVPAETSFETFLRYTDEKERSAELMGGILDEVAATTDPIRLLDIGTGNGEFVTRSLDSMESRDARVEATLVEPSEDLFSRLHDLRNPSFTQPPRLINESIQTFVPDSLYDLVMMSHVLYHVDPSEFPTQIGKMASMVAPGGKLVVVVREADDAADFKNQFKPRLHGKADFRSLTMDEVVRSVTGLPALDGMTVERRVANSVVSMPMENERDRTAIIEFYLNRVWGDMPADIQGEILDYLSRKNGTLRHKDGFMIITRPDPRQTARAIVDLTSVK